MFQLEMILAEQKKSFQAMTALAQLAVYYSIEEELNTEVDSAITRLRVEGFLD